MEVQRLVVEEAHQALTFEFHPGLTIAFHENPAVRAQFIAEFLEGLGPGRSGMHLELIDTQNRRLAIFRPFGDRHRVVDIDRAFDVSPQYIGPNAKVDLLGRCGLDPTSALRRMRLTANQVDRGIDSGTDNHRRARAVASADQRLLWAAVQRLDAANARLAAASAQAAAPLEAARRFQAVADLHAATVKAEREHRRTFTLGTAIGVGCAALGALLLAFDGVVDDKSFTGRVLLGLGAIALVLALVDRRHLHRARAAEAAALADTGADDFTSLRDEAGALADDAVRAELLAATAEATAAADAYRALADDAPLEWVVANRKAIERLAAQREQMARIGAAHLACDEGSVADSARVIVDKVIELREVGFARERLPLLLDEPFIGFDCDDVNRLLDTVMRLTTSHQILLVTGDPAIQVWAQSMAAAAVGFLRIGRGLGSAAASPTNAA